LDVDAIELVDGDGSFERFAFADFREANEDFPFQTFQLAVGDVEEVAASRNSSASGWQTA